MRALLIQHGCEAVLEVLPAYMEGEVKAELNKKAHSVVILCLGNKVPSKVTRETTTAGVCVENVEGEGSSYGYAWWWMEMARSLRLALVDHHRKTSSDDTPPSTHPFQTSFDDTLNSSSEDTFSFDDTWE
ncbi:hypothetical protein Tco_0052228 [Tanacetum coccineum]